MGKFIFLFSCFSIQLFDFANYLTAVKIKQFNIFIRGPIYQYYLLICLKISLQSICALNLQCIYTGCFLCALDK